MPASSPLTIGTATARPGQISTGFLDAFPLPTGLTERLPVIIAQGDPSGPVLWITTGIHGIEHTGLIVLHRLVTTELVSNLQGTLIALPALSPAGLRTSQRSPYYHAGDPNRIFPGSSSPADQSARSALEETFARLFETIVATQPVALIDLHNAWIGSIPFALRDPIFYRQGRSAGDGLTRTAARTLHASVGDLQAAIGFTIVNDFAAEEYLDNNLHRSLSGSLLNQGGLPSMTLELGSQRHVDPGVVEAALAGLRNVMRWGHLLDDPPEPVEGIPVIDLGYPVRRLMTPRLPRAGVVHHLVRPGATVEPGQPLVRLTDIFGQPLGPDDGVLRSQHAGFVIGWQPGVIHYQGDAVMALAVRDANDLVLPYQP